MSSGYLTRPLAIDEKWISDTPPWLCVLTIQEKAIPDTPPLLPQVNCLGNSPVGS